MAKNKPPIRKKQFPTVESLQVKIDEYFNDKGRTVFTLGGLCDYLDLTYEGFAEYGRRPAYSGIVKKAKQKVQVKLNEMALENKLNPTLAIFNLKCNFGWKEDLGQQEEPEQDSKIVVEIVDARKKG